MNKWPNQREIAGGTKNESPQGEISVPRQLQASLSRSLAVDGSPRFYPAPPRAFYLPTELAQPLLLPHRVDVCLWSSWAPMGKDSRERMGKTEAARSLYPDVGFVSGGTTSNTPNQNATQRRLAPFREEGSVHPQPLMIGVHVEKCRVKLGGVVDDVWAQALRSCTCCILGMHPFSFQVNNGADNSTLLV